MIITIVVIIILIVVVLKTKESIKNQREMDRLEMVDLEMKFENLEEKLDKLLSKLNLDE